jgi:hypothetical protein
MASHLHPLAVGTTAVVDVLTSGIAADKRDGPNRRIVAEKVDRCEENKPPTHTRTKPKQ